MKKSYLFFIALVVGVICLATSLKAQTTLLYQNFEASTTSAPTGWTQQQAASDPSNLGWVFGNSFTGGFSSNIPAHTYYTLVDDYDPNYPTTVGNNDTLYSPAFSCSGQAHVFVSFDLMLCLLNGYETANLIVSNDGGITWNTIAPNNYGGLPGAQGQILWEDSLVFDISAYAANKANVKVAFTYFDGCPNPYGNNGTGGGMALDNIDVYVPLNYDLSVISQNLPFLMKVGSPFIFTGVIENYGGDSISSMHMKYSVNGGKPQSDLITGISGFAALTTYNFTQNVPFTPPATGLYTVKFWADSLNGTNADQSHGNDTLVATFYAADSLYARTALFEEVTCQSCPFCLLSQPNVDSVSATNKATCNVLAYHINSPGNDFMYSADSAIGDSLGWLPFIYYNAQGTPQGQLDGQVADPDLLNPAPNYTTPTVATDVSAGSLFKINITNCTYDITTNTYNLSASISSYANVPAGLSVKVALAVDSITYPTDWNDEVPVSAFAPPLGSTPLSNGGYPDYLYPSTLKFTNVVMAVLPNANGKTMKAFKSDSAQTINVSWIKNRPWSFEAQTHPYDSSATAHMVVFIQSNNGIASLAVPAQEVLQSASALVTNFVGINELSNGVNFNMYPNPTDGNTNIAFALDKEQNVTIGIYNMLGQQVYFADHGKVAAGHQTISLAAGTLSAGVYMVKFTTDNSSTTQRLVIQK